jgi:hypothetical protein
MSKRRTSLSVSIGKMFGMRSPVIESNEEIISLKTGHLSVQENAVFKGVYNQKKGKDNFDSEESSWDIVLTIKTREEDDFTGIISYVCANTFKKLSPYETEIKGCFETNSQGEVKEIKLLKGFGDLKTFLICADTKVLDLDVMSAELNNKEIVLTGNMNLTKIE